jgi:hypothetical protein
LQTIHCQTKSTLYGIHCRLWSCQLSSLVCDTLQAVELSRLSKTYLTIHTYIGDLQLENFRGSYQP